MQQKCVALISHLFTPKLTVAHWLLWQRCKYFAQAERSDKKPSKGEGKGGRDVRLVFFFFFGFGFVFCQRASLGLLRAPASTSSCVTRAHSDFQSAWCYRGSRRGNTS